MDKFERTACKCPKKTENGRTFVKCLVQTVHESHSCFKNWSCVVWSQYFLPSLWSVINGLLKGVQHLPFVYCSLNGDDTFTGIDGSFKWFQVMYNWKYLSASSVCTSQNKETCRAAFYPDVSVRSFSKMKQNRELFPLLHVEPSPLKGTQHPFNFCWLIRTAAPVYCV